MEVLDVLGDGGLLSTVIPNYKQRDGQIKMAEAINNAYKDNKTVIINAPTGNGKSIGGLVPAILNKMDGKTIISTATKSLQSQYADKDLPMLHKILDFESHVLKGRDNYICNNKFLEDGKTVLPSDIYDDIKSWFETTTYGDFEELSFVIPQTVKSKISSNSDTCLEEECPYAKKCFYQKNKEKCVTSDVVVINHDLLALYLILKEKYKVSIFGDVNSIIIDEAHKLEDVVTKHLGFKFGVNVCKSYIRNIIKYNTICLKKGIIRDEDMSSIESMCNSLEYQMSNLFETFLSDVDETHRLYPNNFDYHLCGSILDLIDNLFRHTKTNDFRLSDKDKKRYDSIKSKYHDLHNKFNMIMKCSDNIDKYVYYVDTCDDINLIKLNISPIEVSSFLNHVLFDRHKYLEDGNIATVTLMSATLFVNHSFDFAKSRLGINTNYSDCEDEICLTELSVPDIFDYKHQALLYVPKGIVNVSNNQSEKFVFTNQLIKIFKDLSDIVDGGILGLFTSYSEMDKVYDAISEYGTDKNGRNVYNQRLLPKPKLISNFREDEDSILLGTSSLWEGMDIQGKSCSCVIIDRIPFPVPTEPIIEARIEKIKRNNDDWFNGYYLPIAIIALQQGFGRLIRTHKDLGVIVIMDNRIITKNYGKRIINSLPNCLKTRNIDKVKLFYDIVKKKRRLRNRKGK